MGDELIMILTDYIRTFSNIITPTINVARVRDIVSIDSNGVVRHANYNAGHNSDVWFLMYIKYGSTRRSILFDGNDKWIPLTRRYKLEEHHIVKIEESSPLVSLGSSDKCTLKSEIELYIDTIIGDNDG